MIAICTAANQTRSLKSGAMAHVDAYFKMARPKRFELLTPRFVVWCSIQLSYGRVFRRHFGAPGPGSCRMQSGDIYMVAKAGHSYRLRTGLARSGKNRSARLVNAGESRRAGESLQYLLDSGFARAAKARNDGKQLPRNAARELSPRAFVADDLELHRAVGDRDPEGGADGALDQMDVAAMGADQFG